MILAAEEDRHYYRYRDVNSDIDKVVCADDEIDLGEPHHWVFPFEFGSDTVGVAWSGHLVPLPEMEVIALFAK